MGPFYSSRPLRLHNTMNPGDCYVTLAILLYALPDMVQYGRDTGCVHTDTQNIYFIFFQNFRIVQDVLSGSE